MKKLYGLTAGLAALTLACAVFVLDPRAPLDGKGLAGLAVFFLLNLLAESKPLILPTPRGNQAELTISGVSGQAMVALFAPFHAVLAGAFAVLCSEAFVKRKPFVKTWFNTCQTFLSLTIAALVYGAASRLELTDSIPSTVVATTLAVLAYFLVNTGLVSLALACLHGSSFWRSWSAHYSWETLYVVGSIPLALVLIFAYQKTWIAGPVLFLGPLFLLRESYAQYIRLKTNYTETVRTLVKVIETHDTYTAGHSLRVAEYAKQLAMALGLPMRDVEKVEIAAYLHDLGKVDLEITNLVKKPERLTEEERTRVQLHPIVSAELAAQVTLFRGEIEAMIRYHHENHDGSGYPYGLRGEEIPLGARILRVVDTFDAMISSRVYRRALTLEDVKGELRRFTGIHFDPRIAGVFLEACVRDESDVLDQVEPAYEEDLAAKLREAVHTREASRARPEPVLACA